MRLIFSFFSFSISFLRLSLSHKTTMIRTNKTKINEIKMPLCSDIESEPPPEPAPPEFLPPHQSLNPHRDISMASMSAISMKQPSNYVLKIDKNGDQIHEEFIPQSQHGKCTESRWTWMKKWVCENVMMQQSQPATHNMYTCTQTHTHTESLIRSLARSFCFSCIRMMMMMMTARQASSNGMSLCYLLRHLPSSIHSHTHTYIHTHWVRDDGMKCYADASAMCFLSILLTHSALYLHPSNRSTSHTLQYQFQYVLLLPLPATTHSQCCRSLAATAVVVVSPLSCKCPDCPLNVFFYITLHFSLTHSVLFSSFIVRAM